MGTHLGFTRSTHCIPSSHSRSSHDSGSLSMHSTLVPLPFSVTTQEVPAPQTISSQLEGARATSFKTHTAFTRCMPQSGLSSGHSMISSIQVRRSGHSFVKQLLIPWKHLSVTTFSLGKRYHCAVHSPSTSSTQHLVLMKRGQRLFSHTLVSAHSAGVGLGHSGSGSWRTATCKEAASTRMQRLPFIMAETAKKSCKSCC